jgi:hypothetical protein
MNDCVTLKIPIGEVGDIVKEFGKRRIGQVDEVIEHLDGEWMKAVVLFDTDEEAQRYRTMLRKRWKMILYTEKEETPAVISNSEITTPEKANEVAQVFVCKR